MLDPAYVVDDCIRLYAEEFGTSIEETRRLFDESGLTEHIRESFRVYAHVNRIRRVSACRSFIESLRSSGIDGSENRGGHRSLNPMPYDRHETAAGFHIPHVL